MSKSKHPAIHVAATRENFRRAGQVFGTEPKTIALAALHPDEHAAIVADKSLVVVNTVVHLDAAEAAALPHGNAAHVTAAAAKLDSLSAGVDETHAKRATALADIEADLKRREAEIERREKAIAQRETNLEHEHAQLAEQRNAFDEQRVAYETSKHIGVEGVKHSANSKASATDKASR